MPGVQSEEAAQMRPGKMKFIYGDCTDPRQWQLWDEVVLRREAHSRSMWYGPDAADREYNMETRRWEGNVPSRSLSTSEIIQLPAVGRKMQDMGDNDAALRAYGAIRLYHQ